MPADDRAARSAACNHEWSLFESRQRSWYECLLCGATQKEGDFSGACSECERLRAQRDYYRRRWLRFGIRWPVYIEWPQTFLDALKKAQAQDG